MVLRYEHRLSLPQKVKYRSGRFDRKSLDSNKVEPNHSDVEFFSFKLSKVSADKRTKTLWMQKHVSALAHAIEETRFREHIDAQLADLNRNLNKGLQRLLEGGGFGRDKSSLDDKLRAGNCGSFLDRSARHVLGAETARPSLGASPTAEVSTPTRRQSRRQRKREQGPGCDSGPDRGGSATEGQGHGEPCDKARHAYGEDEPRQANESGTTPAPHDGE